MATKPVIFGLTGLGGFAGGICDRLLRASAAAEPFAKLIAVCDPAPERIPERVAQLKEHNIPLVRDFGELLNFPIEAVWLPVPIHLHRSFTEMALGAGKGVLCEKPAAGAVDEVDQMIAARDASKLPVAIGFQDIYQPPFQETKRRLVAGEFGKPLEATVNACWPRGEIYFKRNDWAGRLKRGDTWVLDSPINNAMAHFIHLALHLLSAEADKSADVNRVQAELYRANPIENFDTCTLRFSTRDGKKLHVAMTHACAEQTDAEVDVRTEHARIVYRLGKHVKITQKDGRQEVLPLTRTPHAQMIESFHSWMRNGPESAPGVSLEMARAHTVAINLASEAAPIHDIPAEQIDVVTNEQHSSLRTVEGIIDALRACTQQRNLLSECGLVDWSQSAGTKEVQNRYTHFAGPYSVRQ